MKIKHKSSGKTDVGLVRTNNEDNFFFDSAKGIYVVCDGMGGHNAGEIASLTACELIEKIFNKLFSEINEDKTLGIEANLPSSGDVLLKAIRLSNRKIHNQALINESQSGMGTTVVAAVLEDDFISIVHVGDSRLYRLDKEKLTPLTTDHSWIAEVQRTTDLSEEELSSVVGKNVITRALGVKGTVEADYSLVKVNPGDLFILCSDGLCSLVPDDDIFKRADKNRGNLDSLVDRLIELAKEHGGKDNITVIAIEIEDVLKTVQPNIEPFTNSEEDQEILDIEDNWLEQIENTSDEIIETEEKPEPSSPNKLFLFSIFALFVIIAVVMIYMVGN